MQTQLIPFRLLATVVVLLLLASQPLTGIARPGKPSAGLMPVASFNFENATQLGQDSTPHGRQGAIVGKVGQVDSPYGCAAEFDGKSRISVPADGPLNFNKAFS